MMLGQVTTQPAQGAAPPSTISPYPAPVCSWAQKVTGTGPFTCAFDVGTAVANAFTVPGMYAALAFPTIVNSPERMQLASVVIWGGVAFLIYSMSKGGKH